MSNSPPSTSPEPVRLDVRLANLGENLRAMAAAAVGAVSFDELDTEPKREIARSATAITSLVARHMAGENVTQEIRHERAQMLLWAWIGAGEVRKAWSQFLRGVMSVVVAGVEASAAALVSGLF